MTRYLNDVFDGQENPPLVITSDHVLTEVYQGTVHVEGAHLELRARIEGTLALHAGARATISGRQAGTVNVEPGSQVVVLGAIEGASNVHERALMIVERGGRLAGTPHNDGRVIVRGVIGGARSGSGDLVFEGDGHEKQPRMKDGIRYYEW